MTKIEELTPLQQAEEQLNRLRLEYHRLVGPRPPSRPLPSDHRDVVFYKRLVESAEKNVARLRAVGDVAQLGERGLCKPEVEGSIPSVSTAACKSSEARHVRGSSPRPRAGRPALGKPNSKELDHGIRVVIGNRSTLGTIGFDRVERNGECEPVIDLMHRKNWIKLQTPMTTCSRRWPLKAVPSSSFSRLRRAGRATLSRIGHGAPPVAPASETEAGTETPQPVGELLGGFDHRLRS